MRYSALRPDVSEALAEWSKQRLLTEAHTRQSTLRASQSNPYTFSPNTATSKQLDFCTFALEVLGLTLTRAQWVLCRVAFDGAEPCELEGEDREIARQLFGNLETIPKIARAVVVAMIGARAGKTWMFSQRLLHLALTVSLARLAPGELGFGLLVAPDLKLARQGLRYISGAVHSTPSLARMLVNETMDNITLKRDDGQTVTIECLPCTRGGSAVRGRSLFGAFGDEAAFFRDSNSVVNDEDLYKAIAPRIVPTGQFIFASTPWAEAGLLYTLFKDNRETPVAATAVHAPTLLMRDDEDSRNNVAREYARDPQNAENEFGAQPLSAGTSQFFTGAAIKLSVIQGAPLIQLPTPVFAPPAWAGLDTGFRKNPSVAVIVRRSLDGFIDVAEIIEITPAKDAPLRPTETIGKLLERAKIHRCQQVLADQHYIESVREQAGGFNLTQAPNDTASPYVTTLNLMLEGKLRIPAGHEKLIAQLKLVVSKPTPGGNLSISSPTRGRDHGDQVSALVLAVHGAVSGYGAVPVVVKPRMTEAGDLTPRMSRQDRGF